ncbi:MAG: hypothetical protein HUJ72_02745 [Blautia sp.]|nr:hypothetical protein [Blautia sp.]
MGAGKKIIAVLVSVSVAAGAIYGGAYYYKKNSIKAVPVVKVKEITNDWYYEETSLSGEITTNVSQRVTVDKDMVIKDVFVSEGDTVKAGDDLVSFDLTLVQMELRIAQLKRKQLDYDLEKAEKRLYSLKNGGPIDETQDQDLNGLGNSDLSGTDDDDLGDDLAMSEEESFHRLSALMLPKYLLAEAILPLMENGQDMEQNGQIEMTEPQSREEGRTEEAGEQTESEILIEPSESEIPVDPVEPENPDVPYDPAEPNDPTEPNDPAEPGDDDSDDEIHYFDTDDTDSPDEINLADQEESNGFISEAEIGNYYTVLDENAVPFIGSGTKEDPFVYLCSTFTGKVVASNSFLTFMKMNGYWFQIEFYNTPLKEEEFIDRHSLCAGYFLVNGSKLNFIDKVAFYLEEALQFGDNGEEDDEYDDMGLDDLGGDDSQQQDGSMTRSEAIKLQENRVASLNLDIQEAELNLRKLERKASREVVQSKIDGVVVSVGDIYDASSGSEFLKIKSKDGFFIKGTVSELMRDQLTEGTTLKCTGYVVKDFEATVIEVSDYPVNSDAYYDGNPNVSSYSYMASIADQSKDYSSEYYTTIKLKEESGKNRLIVSKAFVRTENGSSYVYKKVDDVLKKTPVKVDSIVDSGYSVMISAGLRRDDYVAFPYGKNVQDGAPVVDSKLEDLYGY